MNISSLRGKGVVCLVVGAQHLAAVTAYATSFNSQDQLGLGHEDDVEAAQLIRSEDSKDKVFTWAGAAGQVSVVAARQI
jgi:hypothetical protein